MREFKVYHVKRIKPVSRQVVYVVVVYVVVVVAR